MIDLIHSIAVLLSMFLTIPALAVCQEVCRHWWTAAWEAIRQRGPAWVASDWFVVGVLVSFAGEYIDNIYWGVTWSVDYVCPNSELRNILFRSGVYPNIPFRQGAAIVAGLCHLKAFALKFEFPEIYYWRLLTISIIGGLGYVAMLEIARRFFDQ